MDYRLALIPIALSFFSGYLIFETSLLIGQK